MRVLLNPLASTIRGSISTMKERCSPLLRSKANPLPTLRYVSLDEFDLILKDAFSPDRSYSENIKGLTEVHLQVEDTYPNDPHSSQYRDFQLRLYERLAARTYNPAETERANGLSLREAVDNPFPYSTRDPIAVGTYLMASGHIIQVIGSKPARRILELGAGWGHTTIDMARCGYNVTALDIEPLFTELIKMNAARLNCKIDVHCGTFDEVSKYTACFDVILFFACFHHCFEHAKLIPMLRTALSPGGRVILCNEPVGHGVVPYPWGIRLDGHSLWAIRTHGWMELGFHEDYLIDLFAKNGFTLTKHVCQQAGDSGIILEFGLR
jgi:2-polyprenyl-3-methyl-5-hydroxy-6-metoxy-1,4-benzoquinol methylase